MKISTARLKQIIKEELFYREFHRETEEKKEAPKKKEATK